jgi:hypothetical protein
MSRYIYISEEYYGSEKIVYKYYGSEGVVDFATLAHHYQIKYSKGPSRFTSISAEIEKKAALSRDQCSNSESIVLTTAENKEIKTGNDKN